MGKLRPSDSKVDTTHLVLPPDTNHHGTAFGGKIMQWMDVAAGIAAARHGRKPVVTLSVDALHFERPIRLGDVVVLTASVNHTGRTSMEVGVRVDRENPITRQHEHCLTGYFTFVAVDEAGKPQPIAPVEPETPDEQRRFEDAARRREQRLERARRRQERDRERSR